MVKEKSKDIESPNKIPLLAKLVYGIQNIGKKSLNHEEGIGSPCSKCESCDGLDLHFWRKVCKNCGCKFEDHEVESDVSEQHETIVYSLLNDDDGGDYSSASASDNEDIENHPYVKEFSNNKEKPTYGKIGTETLEPYEPMKRNIESSVELEKNTRRRRSIRIRRRKSRLFSEVDQNNNTIMDDLNNETEKEAEKSRQQDLARQIPPQDFDSGKCHDLNEDEQVEQKLYIQLVQEKIIGKGVEKINNEEDEQNCKLCKTLIASSDIGIIADRLPGQVWHSSCFKCFTCQEVLVDNIYFNGDDGKIFCGRHFGETIKKRCNACDELIFSRDYTKADGYNWHHKHFCCSKCDKQLAGNNYVTVKDQPNCIKCYHEYFAEQCKACGIAIELENECLEFDSKTWHVLCFKCHCCDVNLEGVDFIEDHDLLFCSDICADKGKL